MKEGEANTQLATQDRAVLDLLEELLAEVPPAEPSPTLAEAEPATAVEATPAELATAPLQVPAEPVAEPPRESLNKPESQPLKGQRECVVYGLEDSVSDLPESRFSAVIIAVGRYRFAVPLNMLDSVARVTSPVTRLVKQANWHRGMVKHRGQQLTLVDIGELAGLSGVDRTLEPDHVLVLPGSQVGLLSDRPPEPVTLRGGGIRWSSPDNPRPWFAGLLPDHMCVLLDVEQLVEPIGHDLCLTPDKSGLTPDSATTI